VARRLRRLALSEASCQGASEDFVPPAAQRKAVRRTPGEHASGGTRHRPVQLLYPLKSVMEVHLSFPRPSPASVDPERLLSVDPENYFDPSSKRRATRFSIPRVTVGTRFGSFSARQASAATGNTGPALGIVIRSTMGRDVISLPVCFVMRNIGVEHS